ncbi:MAG: SDR family NAD(P)-dependent oxidoreductase [Pseudomonadota bacterium]
MSRLSFLGRTAVITGAASGIGRALAAALAARGAHLALADVDANRLDQVGAVLASNDRRVTTTWLDVSSRSAVKAFADEVERQHGEAHFLFNNAGVGVGGEFERVSEADFDWLMGINFDGVVSMTRAFLPMMRQVDAAQIVNISSIYGVIAPAGQTAYSASKFAVRGFSNALRHELEGDSVGVTVVHPGGINTRIAENARAPEDASEDEIRRGREMAKRFLIMAPERAADIILRGVERRRGRVLVGRDAHALAIMERLWPVGYWRRVTRFLGAATMQGER